MYQIRLICPKGSDAFLANELEAFFRDIFGRDNPIDVDWRTSKKLEGHVLVYLTIANNQGKGGGRE